MHTCLCGLVIAALPHWRAGWDVLKAITIDAQCTSWCKHDAKQSALTLFVSVTVSNVDWPQDD